MSDVLLAPDRRRFALLSDMTAMVIRGVRLTSRNLEAQLNSIVLPVLILLLFVYLFGGALEQRTGSYVDYVVPGVLVMCAGYVSALTAATVSQDMTEGVIDRFRSMNVSGASMLTGHVAASVVRNAAATVVLLGVAYLIGFRPAAGPSAWLVVAVVLFAFVLAISWLSAAFGLLVRTPEGAGAMQFIVMFLPYPSSGFVPIETMPSWLRVFAEYQPVTPVIESLRTLLTEGRVDGTVAAALAWSAALVVAAVGLTGILFKYRTR